MEEETFADRVKYYIPPELRGIPQGLAAVNKMFNPVEILRDAGGKSRQFFDSGGKDIQAGIGALTDTALLGAGPVALRIGQAGREPAKMGLKYLQELFYPLGAPDDVAQQAVKIADPSKRDFMKKAGAVGILSAVPAVRGIQEIMPVTKTAKAIKSSPKIVGGVKEVLSIMKKYENKIKEEIDLENKFGADVDINPSAVSDSTRLGEEADYLMTEMRFEMDSTFKKTDADGIPIEDKKGNTFNKVLDASEKQAVKEMFENMSDVELGRIADDLVEDDSFLHPDVLDNFLEQVTTRSIDEKSLNPERYSSWMITTPEKVVEKIKENAFVVENTEIGRQAREVLKSY